MTRRTIWIFNFFTTIVLFIVFLAASLRNLISHPSDKDIIVILFLIAVLLYLGAIGYLFYNGVFKWDLKKVQSFYGVSFPIAALSLFFLINLVRNVANELTIPSASDALVIIICGLNAATFCWGLIIKRN